ncbi:hypothetical protein HID58_091616 [Brassica napus]|uniref:26S proteasome regulatory subunit 7-like OB domain-containing protein n=1 Tax=Brassica napus TaxID=3708 RepID=A0ABQ7WZ86_BRANA|nr:hypothetical protein HID58_091616 [Brassica napus]
MPTLSFLLISSLAQDEQKRGRVLRKAPEGSMKNKIHGLGLKLLARVKPSEIFLKSISKEVTSIQVSYPPSLDPRLVRRRLLEQSCTKVPDWLSNFASIDQCIYGIAITKHTILLGLVPHIFHWRALQGSEQLLKLLPTKLMMQMNAITTRRSLNLPHVFCCHQRSYASYLVGEASEEGLSEETIVEICKLFHLNKIDVLKYRNLSMDLVSDKQMMQEEQPLQVARCTKIISPNTEDAKYFVVGLGDKVSPTDIEEGMRVGVDRNKYQIQIPRPPKIDPSVTMMTVEEKPDVTLQWCGGCKEQIEKMREVFYCR